MQKSDPPRKKKNSHTIDRHLVRNKKPNKLILRRVSTVYGIFAVGLVYTSDGIDHARIGKLFSYLEAKKEVAKDCNIIAVYCLLMNPSFQVVIIAFENHDGLIESGKKLTTILSGIASKEYVKGWKDFIPAFVFGGDHTPPKMKCLSSYISKEDYQNILPKLEQWNGFVDATNEKDKVEYVIK